jgi:2-haloacid dehalogenase
LNLGINANYGALLRVNVVDNRISLRRRHSGGWGEINMTKPTASLGLKPEWLTFDCYGTLIQWDEGLLAAVEQILAKQSHPGVDAATLIRVYDKYEHALESEKPHESFRTVAGESLKRAMGDLRLSFEPSDIEILTSNISRMPPFPEVVSALSDLKRQGFKLCIISNTDDDVIAGNVAQLGGCIDRVVTAQQAQAYKPSRRIFAHAYKHLGVDKDQIVHICASPHLDLVAARDIGFRCIWIDRGTGRRAPPDYSPDAIFQTLDRAPIFFESIGWGS